ncbi:MAG: hypothetical protein IVW53_08850 [Chloroflexi bacterium]|nr:hypothetical protein [Chloroflexota bacterium]
MNDRTTIDDVGPIVAEVSAPAALVFQMIGAIGQGPQRPGDRADVLARDGDSLICDFRTTVRLPLGRRRSVRTREAVRLVPPDRVEYEHLDGPVRGLRESITVESIEDHRSRLVYRGTYGSRGRLARAVFRLLSKGTIERAMDEHFTDLRQRAEARAVRSRAFAVEPAVEPVDD